MGVYIKIKKMIEKNSIGYYLVSTKDFGGAEFYIGIDKKKRLIKFYLTKDLSNPIKVIDCNKRNEPIGILPGIDVSILGRVIMKAIKALGLEIFPDYLSYEA
jgi:hypothetical protein